MRSVFLGCYGDDELEARILPDIKKPEELKKLVGLNTVHVHPDAYQGVAYLGFQFGCSWDEEHGRGVAVHKNRVVEIGAATTAFDYFKDPVRAEREARKKTAKSRPSKNS